VSLFRAGPLEQEADEMDTAIQLHFGDDRDGTKLGGAGTNDYLAAISHLRAFLLFAFPYRRLCTDLNTHL